MGLLEVRKLVFQAGQFGAQLVRLLGQKLRGFVGPLGALFHVFIEKQRDQFIGHFLGHFRLLVFERHVECHRGLAPSPDEGTERGDHDRAAHLIDLVGFAKAFALVGIQVVLVHDPQQVVAGHDTLANDLDSLVGKTVVVRRYQLRRDLLRFHQDGTGRLVDRRHAHRDRHGRRENDYDTHPKHHGSVLDYGDVIFEGELVVRFHRGHQARFQRSGYLYVSVSPTIVPVASGTSSCWRSLYINDRRRSQNGENSRLAHRL
ncbi:hypothetical protein D3C81_441740 [compost metagenome]